MSKIRILPLIFEVYVVLKLLTTSCNVVHRSPDLFIIEHLSKAEAHILALRSLNLPFKYIITSLFLYPLLLGAPLPLGALRVRVVCLWVNPALIGLQG